MVNAGIATVAAVLMLTAIVYASVSVRVKETAEVKVCAEIEEIEGKVIKKVAPEVLGLPWKAALSFFK